MARPVHVRSRKHFSGTIRAPRRIAGTPWAQRVRELILALLAQKPRAVDRVIAAVVGQARGSGFVARRTVRREFDLLLASGLVVRRPDNKYELAAASAASGCQGRGGAFTAAVTRRPRTARPKRVRKISVDRTPSVPPGMLPPHVAETSLLKNERNVPVWFGTNRAIVGAGATRRFTSQATPELSYGRCIVNVPFGHRAGDTGPTWLERCFGRGEDRRLRIVHRSHHVGELEHRQDLARELAEESLRERPMLFFVHGYNVGFDEAAHRTAQLGYDLKIPHLAFFSWPSRGRWTAYFKDAGTVSVTMKLLADYLCLVAEQAAVAGKHLHVLAHSMGNYVLLDALQHALARAQQDQPTLRVASTIFAAPDVPVERFRAIVDLTHRVTDRKTLYFSPHDRALLLSSATKGQSNAGRELTILPSIDTIEVHATRLMTLGHGYYAEHAPVIADMHQLIHHAHPPADRAILFRQLTAAQEVYWRLG